MARIKLKVVRNALFFLAFAILVFASGYKAAEIRSGAPGESLIKQFVSDPTEGAVSADFSKFWEVWRRLEKSYVDPSKLDYAKMTWGAISGLAQSLDDPYTQYLPPKENKQANEDLSGSFFGVGIELGYREGALSVVAPIAGSPAEKAGVKAGDLILNIKDEKKQVDIDTAGMSLPEAVSYIRGEKATPVILTLYREGQPQPFEQVIVRDEIVVPTVELTYIVRGGREFAHLKLFKYGGRTDKEWLKLVSEIVAKNPAGLILDLRNNPGGYLDGAVFVASEFLASGIIVKQEGREGSETYSVDRRGSLLSIPLVILINQGSASASEITAGALQDAERALIVGERSFGKGTVQEVQELSDGSSLHVTIAKWILPSGRWIGEEGIMPDEMVEDDLETTEVDEQIERAVEVLLR